MKQPLLKCERCPRWTIHLTETPVPMTNERLEVCPICEMELRAQDRGYNYEDDWDDGEVYYK